MTNRDKFNKEIVTKSNDKLAFILSNNPCRYCYHKGDCAGITCKVGVKEWLETPCEENPPAEKTNDEINLMNNADDLAVWLKEHLPVTVNSDLLAHLIADGLRGINTPAENNPPETVDHPAHYNRDGAMECIREMVVVFGYEATINFCKLNAWKYRYRASEKNGAEDMAKSDWYVKKVEELTAESYL